jgi:hypothetical protein
MASFTNCGTRQGCRGGHNNATGLNDILHKQLTSCTYIYFNLVAINEHGYREKFMDMVMNIRFPYKAEIS